MYKRCNFDLLCVIVQHHELPMSLSSNSHVLQHFLQFSQHTCKRASRSSHTTIGPSGFVSDPSVPSFLLSWSPETESAYLALDLGIKELSFEDNDSVLILPEVSPILLLLLDVVLLACAIEKIWSLVDGRIEARSETRFAKLRNSRGRLAPILARKREETVCTEYQDFLNQSLLKNWASHSLSQKVEFCTVKIRLLHSLLAENQEFSESLLKIRIICTFLSWEFRVMQKLWGEKVGIATGLSTSEG